MPANVSSTLILRGVDGPRVKYRAAAGGSDCLRRAPPPVPAPASTGDSWASMPSIALRNQL
jgi:hypothetical protein